MPRYATTFMHPTEFYMLDVFTTIGTEQEAREYLEETVYAYVSMKLQPCHTAPADSMDWGSPVRHKLNRHHVESLHNVRQGRTVNSRTFDLLARWKLVEWDGKRRLTKMGEVILNTFQALNECAGQEFNIRSWPMLWNVNADRRHR